MSNQKKSKSGADLFVKLHEHFNKDGKKIMVTIPENEEIRDSENPDYAFQGFDTKLLVSFADPKVDVHYYIRKELANRGLDNKGFWIGFEASKKLHRIL